MAGGGRRPGVWEKSLGIFSECQTEAGFVKLDPGARHQGRGRRIYFVVSGAGEVDGQPLRRFTTLFLEHGQAAEFKAVETMEILRIGLPDLAGIATGHSDLATASAAE
jgi:hypothetical protein